MSPMFLHPKTATPATLQRPKTETIHYRPDRLLSWCAIFAFLWLATSPAIAAVAITSRDTTDIYTFTNYVNFADATSRRSTILGISALGGDTRFDTWTHPYGDTGFTVTPSGSITINGLTDTPPPLPLTASNPDSIASFNILANGVLGLPVLGSLIINNQLAINANPFRFWSGTNPSGHPFFEVFRGGGGGIDPGFPINYTYQINGDWTATSGKFYHNIVSLNAGWTPVWRYDTATNVTTLSVSNPSYQLSNPVNLDVQFLHDPQVAAITADANGGIFWVPANIPIASAAPNINPSTTVPAVTYLTSPNAGQVSFRLVSGATSQPGFNMANFSVGIIAPTATPEIPHSITFNLDTASLHASNPLAVNVFRDGVRAGSCLGASVATPVDPCVTARVLGSGVTTLTVLSSYASTWSFGEPTTNNVSVTSAKYTANPQNPGGATVTVTAQVSGRSPTGSVQFSVNGSPWSAPVSLVNGIATQTLDILTPTQPLSVTAAYSGDVANAFNISPAVEATLQTAESATPIPAIPLFGLFALGALLLATQFGIRRRG